MFDLLSFCAFNISLNDCDVESLVDGLREMSLSDCVVHTGIDTGIDIGIDTDVHRLRVMSSYNGSLLDDQFNMSVSSTNKWCSNGYTMCRDVFSDICSHVGY